MKKLLLLAMTFVFMFSLTACSGSGFLREKDILDVSENPNATITLEYDLNDGEGQRQVELVFELCYDKAPSTVANFIKLAKDGYYDEKIIDYAQVKSTAGELSYISGGQYKIDEDGDIVNDAKKYNIKGEFVANKWDANDLRHELGSLVMDRDSGSGQAFDSASTRFYITLNKSVERDRNYCVFGKFKSSKYTINNVKYSSADSLSKQFIDDMLRMSTDERELKDGSLTLGQAPAINLFIKSVVIDEKGVDYSKAKVAKA